MRCATTGSDSMLELREQALSLDPGFIGRIASDDVHQALEDVDVLFIGGPAGERFALAAAAVRRGVHPFLEWPPAVSLRECADLVQLAEEAGLDVGVSRPLRFLFAGVDRAHVVSMRMASSRRNLLHELSDMVDLSSSLVGSGSVQRIDAETVTSNGLNPITAFSLRFDNGSYVQGLVYGAVEKTSLSLFAAGRGHDLVEEVALPTGIVHAIAEETRLFLSAAEEGYPIPVSVHDALQTMRIVERLMGNLR